MAAHRRKKAGHLRQVKEDKLKEELGEDLIRARQQDDDRFDDEAEQQRGAA
jgi:hypothetical protein